MLEFIAKYWLEFLFGLVVTAATVGYKYIWKLYKNEKHHQKTKEQKEFYSSLIDAISKERKYSDAQDTEIMEQVDCLKYDLDIIKEGLLSIQGTAFKEKCRELLSPDREISLEEFEELGRDHTAYNTLGGNHSGDSLFKMVCQKFE